MASNNSLAMLYDDQPMVSLSQSSALQRPPPQCGNGSGASGTFADGPLICAVIIADPVGRWKDVCSVKFVAARVLKGMLFSATVFPMPGETLQGQGQA
eukprot:3554892-Lingulodinium_polyedra.AAC.1